MHPARFERTLYAVVADLHTYSVVVRDHTHLACTQPDRYLDNQPHHSRGHTHRSGRLNTLDPVDRANLRIPRRHCQSGCNDHNKHQDRDRYHRSWTSMVHSDCYRTRCLQTIPMSQSPSCIHNGRQVAAGQECLDSRGNNGGRCTTGSKLRRNKSTAAFPLLLERRALRVTLEIISTPLTVWTIRIDLTTRVTSTITCD